MSMEKDVHHIVICVGRKRVILISKEIMAYV